MTEVFNGDVNPNTWYLEDGVTPPHPVGTATRVIVSPVSDTTATITVMAPAILDLTVPVATAVFITLRLPRIIPLQYRPLNRSKVATITATVPNGNGSNGYTWEHQQFCVYADGADLIMINASSYVFDNSYGTASQTNFPTFSGILTRRP